MFKSIINAVRYYNNTLIKAAYDGNLEYVIRLIQDGADVNNKRYGSTALICACHIEGNIEIVRELIKAGADINIVNHHGLSALSFACYWNHIDIVRELLMSGAELNGDLLICTIKNWNSVSIEIIKELLKAGADPNITSRDGNAPIQEACSTHNFELFKVLIKAGANPNIQNTRIGPLEISLLHWDTDIITELLRAGADPNTECCDGDTALNMASYKGDLYIVKELLKAGANPNMRDKSGYTPIMRVFNIYEGNYVIYRYGRVTSQYNNKDRLEIANELLKAGANLYLKNNVGLNVFQFVMNDTIRLYLEKVDMVLKMMMLVNKGLPRDLIRDYMNSY